MGTDILLQLFLYSTALLILIPLYMLIVNSFKSSAEAGQLGLSWPREWHIGANYKELIRTGKIMIGYRTSAIVTFTSVAAAGLLTAAAGFTLQRKTGKISESIYLLFVLGMIIPFSPVTTYFVVKGLHLTGGYAGAILVYMTLAIPASVFLYTGFYKTIPRELDESAIMDGCGPARLFFQIVFPLVKPVTATVFIINFMGIWNDFGTAIYYLNSPHRFTVVLSTFSFYGQHSADWNLVFADIVAISLPVVILYLLLQRYIISGMTAGAVKG